MFFELISSSITGTKILDSTSEVKEEIVVFVWWEETSVKFLNVIRLIDGTGRTMMCVLVIWSFGVFWHENILLDRAVKYHDGDPSVIVLVMR
ncbi:MAG: hypothetical protein LBH02_02050 [Methanocalculaceae archaeon]|nr:hypothetical protein [Methanocalculaceae archaeon]